MYVYMSMCIRTIWSIYGMYKFIYAIGLHILSFSFSIALVHGLHDAVHGLHDRGWADRPISPWPKGEADPVALTAGLNDIPRFTESWFLPTAEISQDVFRTISGKCLPTPRFLPTPKNLGKVYLPFFRSRARCLPKAESWIQSAIVSSRR